ncbi:alanine racemase [Oceanobacillus caeni]|uniref:alanine racemase n=1 Tax=Oceanobacillus caeni TaxID=405946 RepID=UPI00214A7D70|nr:alanine racemase [Oceanobacillus caeni]MCR1835366.1 alanine racemase [Oceanobacillus caeni]
MILPNLDSRENTVAEIDLAAFRYNVKQIQSLLNRHCILLAVIKTNAYGHGIKEIAHEAVKAGVERLGVTTVEEGILLRESGITIPIHLLSPINQYDALNVVTHELIASVSSKNVTKAIHDAAMKQEKIATVHLKLDTGIHRFGIEPKKALDFCAASYFLSNLYWEGIYTHFSNADEGDWVTTEKQNRLFEKTVELLEGEGYLFPLKHVGASTIAIERVDMCWKMVRPGIALFGYQPDERQKKLIDLKPVLTLKTKIVQLHHLPSHTKIGYGGTYVTKQDEKIAIIPVGHGDGYKRGLSNKGYVLVRGRFAKIVGTISLDQTFINVTNVPNVQEDDEVILIGTQGKHTISARDIAKWTHSNIDEVLASIMQRIKRKYI